MSSRTTTKKAKPGSFEGESLVLKGRSSSTDDAAIEMSGISIDIKSKDDDANPSTTPPAVTVRDITYGGVTDPSLHFTDHDTQEQIDNMIQSHYDWFISLRCAPQKSKNHPAILVYLWHYFALLMTSNIFPDTIYLKVKSHDLSPNPIYIRFFKFLSLSVLGIAICNVYVEKEDIHRDVSFDRDEFIFVNFYPCILDIFIFFIIGRLYARRGVDCICFILPATLSCYIFTQTDKYDVLSFSLQAGQSLTTGNWIVCGVVALALLYAGVFHVKYAYRDGLLPGRLFELVTTSGLIMSPYLKNPELHLHHWFSAWLIGCHVNQRYWWSFLTMGALWGGYVNGVGTYGRDGLTEDR